MVSKFGNWMRVQACDVSPGDGQLVHLRAETINLTTVCRVRSGPGDVGTSFYFTGKLDPLYTTEDFELVCLRLMALEVGGMDRLVAAQVATMDELR